MKKYFTLLFAFALFFSCDKSKLSKELGCEKTDFQNLELVYDIHKKFSLELPNHWNTNLYYDQNQSSIYAADTTKQLTEAFLLDVTMISDSLSFDNDFLITYKNKLNQKNLVETSSFETPFLGKRSYYSRVLGTKAGYPYQLINLFVITDKEYHLQAKAEVYGDALANERLCEAISLLEKIKLNP